MRLSYLISISAGILISCGVGESFISKLARAKALFFLLCGCALHQLAFSPSDEILLSPAFVFAAVTLYGFTAARGSGGSLGIILSVLLAGAAASFIGNDGTDAHALAVGLVAALPALILDTKSACAAAALAPIAAAALKFAFGLLTNGYDVLDISETTFSAQLTGIITAFIVKSALSRQNSHIHTNVRQNSANRTKTNAICVNANETD